MGIKQKFFVLSGVVGLIMAIVSCVGYYTAYTNLSDSVEKEMMATVEVQNQSVDGWLRQKGQAAESAAKLMAVLDGNGNLASMREMTSLMDGDKDILDFSNTNEDGLFMSWVDGDSTGKIDPKTRDWYQEGKKAGKLIFTEAYQDSVNGKLVVSAVAPYNGKNGSFRGAICEDISLDVLKDKVKEIKYRGEGDSIIIEKSGKILASTQEGKEFTDAADDEILKEHFKDMVSKGSGYFTANDMVLAYTTVPTTGWIMGIAVPESFVFSQLTQMKITYGILTSLGLVIIVLVCLRFSAKITGAILRLRDYADQLADGNLRGENLPVESSDELGVLTQAFNTMSNNIRALIRKMASTSEQVAASSEELTASAQQSAEASNHVAMTVSEVANGMADQMTNIDSAKGEVQHVVSDMNSVADMTKDITATSNETAEAAQNGAVLMNDAMDKMEVIEKSVLSTAEVVKALGENSKQIGQIVDTIAAIADQTNLLALNAAIEAARAGEHGRGFAVVAEEVRKLAAESQESAEQIKERIASIQSDTERAVAAMQSGTDRVQEGTASIKEVGTKFQDIMAKVNAIKEQMDEINSSVQTVSAGANKIVQAVNSIDDVSRRTADHTQTISASTEEQSASTEEIASASQSLAHLAMELQEATGKFKI